MAPQGSLSRFLNTRGMAPSIYEDLRAGDSGRAVDIEERAGLTREEADNYQDYGSDNASQGENDSQTTRERGGLLEPIKINSHRSPKDPRKHKGHRNDKFMSRSPQMLGDDDDGDDDVPASLLIEEGQEEALAGPHRSPIAQQNFPRHERPPTTSRRTKADAQWQAAQAKQQLYEDTTPKPFTSAVPNPRMSSSSAKEAAMWQWVNVTNLDTFMGEVYEYYREGGIWTICLGRLLDLCRTAFVAVFTTFMWSCVNYGQIRHSTSLHQVLVPKCMKRATGWTNVFIWCLSLLLIYQCARYIMDIPRLKRLHNFYLHLLRIPDSDIQTVDWRDIIARIMDLRDDNPVLTDKISPAMRHYMGAQSKQRLDAHNIANRLMRKENYLIAMFNKDILNLTLNIPFVGEKQVFSKTVQWTLQFCILDFLFDAQGQLSPLVLKGAKRRQLSDALRSRFLFAGYMTFIFIPLIIPYTLIVYFFQYFNEYQKNPASLGARGYTPLAEWKFREFNELPHLFEHRLNMSHPFATRYLDQFPKRKTVELARFVSFVAGALIAVLAVATIVDPELFLGFEITKDRTVLFYLGILGAIWGAAHGTVPPENEIFMPEYALRNVIQYTRYQPTEWKDRLHTDDVKREFAELYQLKIVTFIHEVLSILLTPAVCWFALARSSDRIIDFFRANSLHVDGLGYVCSYGVFDFERGPEYKPRNLGAGGEGQMDDYYLSKHGKMAMSYFGFLDNYATNPKTGIPGHVPPGMSPQETRHPFNPPPAFPGLMSPTLHANLGGERMSMGGRPPAGMMGRSRYGGAGGIVPNRAPFHQPSPMPSMTLDRSHMPSGTGFGGGKSIYNNSRSRYAARNIIEFPEESQTELRGGRGESGKGKGRAMDFNLPREESGLDHEIWETSPGRSLDGDVDADAQEGEIGDMGGGVLGLLYQFQKGKVGGGVGVNI